MRTNKGFTLVEVMVIIAVIGILAAIALPRFGGGGLVNKLSVDTVARRIQSDLRLTRTLAITNSSTYYLVVYPATNEYKLYKGSIAPANQVDETRTVSSSITLTGDTTFSFESLGNAGAGSGTSLTLTSGSYSSTIVITLVTGRVAVN